MSFNNTFTYWSLIGSPTTYVNCLQNEGILDLEKRWCNMSKIKAEHEQNEVSFSGTDDNIYR